MGLRIGLHRTGGWMSRLIKWQTRSEYSHASLVLPDDTVLEALQGKGVIHGRSIRSVKEQVDLFEVACGVPVTEAALTFAKAQIGKGYDWTMVIRFLTRQPESRKQSKKWFCSELVYASFAEAGWPLLRDTAPWEVSPELLSKSPYLIPVGTNRTAVTT